MKRLLQALALPILTLAMAFAFIACDGTAPDITYTVTYVIGEGAQGTAPTETDKAVGEKFKLKSADGITLDGNRFIGWSDGNMIYQAGDEYTMPTKAVVFTAQWELRVIDPVSNSVTYDLNGGSGTLPTETDKAVGEKFKLALADGLTNGDKEFDGWSDGTNKYAAGAEYTMPDKAVTLTAQWKDKEQEQPEPPTKYTVTYYLNGGSGTLPTETDKEEGEKFTLAASTGLTNGDKEFDGWSDGTDKYAAGAEYTMPNKAVTFTAQWKDVVAKYTVTILKATNSDLESSVVGEIPAIEAKVEGDKFTLPANALTLPHYTLSVWRMMKYVTDENSEDGYWSTVANYKLDEEIVMPAYDIRIAAHWVANQVTITYDANGGTGTEMKAVQRSYGASLTLASCTYTAPTGMKFAGWSTTPNGAALENGTRLNAAIVSESDTVTLYALWVADEEPANPIDSLVGSWTNGTDTLVISANKVNTYMQGSAILNGKYVLNVFIYDGATSITSLDYSLYYDLYFNDTTVTIIDENEEETVFTTKTAVADSSVSEFVGKWARSGTNQPWVITQDKVYYGNDLSEANMLIIGDYCALYYQIGNNTYVYVVQKDENSLDGYMGNTAVTFNAGTYSLLTVDGVLNQVVSSGAAPDASKIKTPKAPEGKEFAGWVLAGTETPFDVTAVMTADASITATFSDIVVSGNAKTYSGTIGGGFLAKPLTITIDFDTLECTVIYNNNTEQCVLQLKTEGYFFSNNSAIMDGEPFWIIVSDDGNSIEVWEDYNAPYDLKATLTLQA